MKKIASLSSKLEDRNLRETFNFLESKKIIKFDESFLLSKEKEEVKEAVIDKIKMFIQDKEDDLRSRISELRKKGEGDPTLDLKMMRLPLKVKVFLATLSKKDFEKIFNNFGELETEIKFYERGRKH